MRSLLVGSLLAITFFIAAPTAQSDLTGTWAVSFDTPQGAMDATATFKQDGDKLTGTISGPQGDVPLEGSVKGRAFTFTIDVPGPNGQLLINLAGELDGDSIKGTFDFGQGMGDWSGKRNK
jgi:hypothetical protein